MGAADGTVSSVTWRGIRTPRDGDQECDLGRRALNFFDLQIAKEIDAAVERGRVAGADRKRDVPAVEAADLPFVSLLIAAHNEEVDIEARLQNALALQFSAKEKQMDLGLSGKAAVVTGGTSGTFKRVDGKWIYESGKPDVTVTKVERNAPCPCASGRKFKACHA